MSLIVTKSRDTYTGTVTPLPTAERVLIGGGSDQASDYRAFPPPPEIVTGWKKKSDTR